MPSRCASSARVSGPPARLTRVLTRPAPRPRPSAWPAHRPGRTMDEVRHDRPYRPREIWVCRRAGVSGALPPGAACPGPIREVLVSARAFCLRSRFPWLAVAWPAYDDNIITITNFPWRPDAQKIRRPPRRPATTMTARLGLPHVAPCLSTRSAGVGRPAGIGDFMISEQTSGRDRTETDRSATPAPPSGAVERTKLPSPPGRGTRTYPVRLHRERGITGSAGLPDLHRRRRGRDGSHLGDDSRSRPVAMAQALRCTGISVGFSLAPRRRTSARPRPDGPAAPAFITVGNLDGLMDEALDYARRLRTARAASPTPTCTSSPTGRAHLLDIMMPATRSRHRAHHVLLKNWLRGPPAPWRPLGRRVTLVESFPSAW